MTKIVLRVSLFESVWRSNVEDVRKLVEVELGCRSVL